MNILLITSDQQPWHAMGSFNPEISTPRLDQLAREGTSFHRAYCPNPTCTPTRASIITGKYPSQHGAWSLGTKLPEDEETVGDLLQAAGYRTSLVGKAHFQQLKSTPEFPSLESYPIMQDLDFWRDFHGPFYGFDHVELARNHADEAHVGQHYAIWMEENGCDNWRDYFYPPTGNNRTQKHLWEIPERYHYNRWIAERSNALLAEHKKNDEPFFLWASFFDPHPPYLAPEPWDRMYDPDTVMVPEVTPGEHDRNPLHFQKTQMQSPDFSAWEEEGGNAIHGAHSHLTDRDALAKNIAVYYGMISLMDKYIGQILDQLDELGLRDDTLVLFTSDHGHFYGQHGLVAKGPFHYEDLIRVPFIVRCPGQVSAGNQCAAIQSLVDLAPTFLSWCGLEVPDAMTGVDQSATWRGDDSSRDWAIVEHHHQPTTVHLRTYVNERYKLSVYCDQEYGELFDFKSDPQEVRNLWNEPSAQELKAELLWALLVAEMEREECLDDRTRKRPNKSTAARVRECTDGDGYALVATPDGGRLYHVAEDPEREHDLWNSDAHQTRRADLQRQLLFERLRNEPLWMPRVAGA